MTLMDYVVSGLFIAVCIIIICIEHYYSRKKDDKKDLQFLLQVRQVVTEYPEMFENKAQEVEMLDYLIMYYSGEEVPPPKKLYNIMSNDESVNRRKTYFLGYWVYHKQIVNLEFATINLPFINQK